MSVSSRRAERPFIPALLTSQRGSPWRSRTSSIQDVTWPWSVTSTIANSAAPPADSISETVSAPPAALRPHSATGAPVAAIAIAIARPMPPEAPVTTATGCPSAHVLTLPPAAARRDWRKR